MDAVFLSAHVPVFYLLSGYFVKRTDWHATLQRAVFLAIPYLFWNVIAWLILWVQGRAGWSWGDVSSLLRGYPNMPTWFLRNLIVYTLFLPFLRNRAIAAASAVVLMIGVMIDVHSSFLHSQQRLMGGAVFFLLGFCLRKVPLERIRAYFVNTWKFWFGAGMAASVLFGVFRWESGVTSASSLIGCMGVLALSVALFAYMPRVGRLAARCGEATFLVFVVHFPVILLCGWENSQYLPCWNYGYTVLFGLGCLALAAGLLAFLKKMFPCILPYVAACKPESASLHAQGEPVETEELHMREPVIR